jgi:two-component system sensor histidine kinase/response regulator
VDLPANLTQIAGLDTQQGLGYLHGHATTYRRLLGVFAREHSEDMQRLRGFLHDGQRDDARRLAHGLKSIAGSLGMSGVQRMAVALEAAITRGADPAEIAALAIPVEAELHRLTTAIQAALPAAPAELASIDIDWAQVRHILENLQPLLTHGNMEANRIVETHRILLHAALGPIGSELEKKTEAFLYPEAIKTLQRAFAEAATHET